MHSWLSNFDQNIAAAIQRLPLWFAPIMQAATLIGLPVVIIVLALLASGISWLKGSHRFAYAQLATLVALGGNSVLKHIFHRARPDTLYAGHMKIHSYSFPSGHAFGAAVFYGLWAYLAYTYLPRPWNIVASVVLILVVLLIGISRVYLGAHFPSDVVVGWVLGSLSLLIIVKLIRP